MVSTPRRFNDFSAADLTYSGVPLIPEFVTPNLVARNIWFLFPVFLNLGKSTMISATMPY
jgi:hypothetical protein